MRIYIKGAQVVSCISCCLVSASCICTSRSISSKAMHTTLCKVLSTWTTYTCILIPFHISLTLNWNNCLYQLSISDPCTITNCLDCLLLCNWSCLYYYQSIQLSATSHVWYQWGHWGKIRQKWRGKQRKQNNTGWVSVFIHKHLGFANGLPNSMLVT